MSTKEQILAEAEARARANGVPYAGLLLPAEAHQLLKEHPDAVLIDVRSKAEWDFVGRIPGAVEIEWKSYPGMALNPKFAEQLASKVKKDAVAMFICRSGGRSHQRRSECRLQVELQRARGIRRRSRRHGPSQYRRRLACRGPALVAKLAKVSSAPTFPRSAAPRRSKVRRRAMRSMAARLPAVCRRARYRCSRPRAGWLHPR